MDARVPAVCALVRCCDDAFSGGDAVELAPRLARLDTIDSTPPGIEGYVLRGRDFRLLRQSQDVAGDTVSETAQIRLDLPQHRGREFPAEVRAQQRIVVVLVAEPWLLLNELGHMSSV